MTTAPDGYTTVDKLLLGNIPLPGYVDAQQFVNDAADEIDSQIGFKYKTRVDMTNVNLSRPAKLLLQRINVYLASGRLLLNLAAPGEEDRLHAYALSLIQSATKALASVASGDITLEGAELLPGTEDDATGPMIANVDAESNVEAFYDRIANPGYSLYGPFGSGPGVYL